MDVIFRTLPDALPLIGGWPVWRLIVAVLAVFAIIKLLRDRFESGLPALFRPKVVVAIVIVGIVVGAIQLYRLQPADLRNTIDTSRHAPVTGVSAPVGQTPADVGTIGKGK